jgi:hypothetical protein
VAENVDTPYGYFRFLAGRNEDMSEKLKTKTTSLLKTAAPSRYEPRVPATH